MEECPNTGDTIYNIAKLVAAETDTDVLELTPIVTAVEAGALRRLIEDSPLDSAATVTFNYADCVVSVSQDKVKVTHKSDDRYTNGSL